LGAENVNQISVSGFNKKVVGNNKVYPARATTGVNRAYLPGILDDSLRLVNFTAACGPVIYNGHLFGKEYYGNAFVAEPSANLIKRNVFTNEGYSVIGSQAYANKEFLRSTDERFRPVNLFNGPDGALYIVDMYRGIIQHKTYLTPYLKNEIKQRSLTEPLSYGRIYKVVQGNKKPKAVTFPDNRLKLVKLLGHENGWVRSMAQQIIVDAGDHSIAKELRKVLKTSKSHLAKTHALWTLEGLGILKLDDLRPLLTSTVWQLRMQALAASRFLISKENYKEFVTLFENIIKDQNSPVVPYVAFLASNIKPFNRTAYKELLLNLGKKFGSDIYVADAIISSLKSEESAYLEEFSNLNPDTSLVLSKRLKKVIADSEKAKRNKIDLTAQYPRGASIYKSFCQTCHGSDGNGVASLAPPLNNSEWVFGNKNKLNAIVLYGLTGPIQIGSKLYKSPEINGEMPGIASNDQFSDHDIAQLLNYIRNSWTNKGDKVLPNDVTEIRNRFMGRQKPFTMEELNQLK
jgi:mono/diheme cytochrome c family protein